MRFAAKPVRDGVDNITKVEAGSYTELLPRPLRCAVNVLQIQLNFLHDNGEGRNNVEKRSVRIYPRIAPLKRKLKEIWG